jgi:hypothetical protein
MVEIDTVPFDSLKIGEKVESFKGTPGVIAGLYPEGTETPHGSKAKYGGEILFLWSNGMWSLTWHFELKVKIDRSAAEKI